MKAGVHAITTAITPKTGNTFIGEYGAILDGTGWTSLDANQGAIRAHNENIDDVTISNLVIRNMPQKGIHAFRDFADRWIIEYNEISANKSGLLFPNHSIIRNNHIHHNVGSSPLDTNPAERGGGYVGYQASHTTLDSNEIAYNSTEQKVIGSVNVTFRNNFVHHNIGDGIWYDSGNHGALVENNLVEDNGREGIFYEASGTGIIRDNAVRRSGVTGIFISMSQNVQIYNNTLEDNFRGLIYFVDCGALSDGLDLENNSARDNTIRVATRSGALASGFTYTGDCTSTQIAAFLNGSKSLVFSRNTYLVPSLTAASWMWNGPKEWREWQSLRHDVDGAIAR